MWLFLPRSSSDANTRFMNNETLFVASSSFGMLISSLPSIWSPPKLDSVFSLGCLFSHKWQLPWFSKIFYHAYLKNKKSTKNGYLWKLSAIESGKRKKDKLLRLPDPYLDIFAFSMTSRMMEAGVMSLSGCPIHFYFYCPVKILKIWNYWSLFHAIYPV